MNKHHLEELLAFIRQHRSNDANIDKLRAKLNEEIEASAHHHEYVQALRDIKEKQIEEFHQSRKEGSTTWPEYEKFVSAFERAITEALRSAT